MTQPRSLDFTCVHVAAIDPSMTELQYAECVNRSGVTAEEIGCAIIKALHRLPEVTDGIQIVVRFSHDT